VVTYLVNHKADINAKNNIGNTALAFSRRNGHLNIARFLKKEGNK